MSEIPGAGRRKVAGIVPYALPLSWVPLVLGAVAATKPGVSERLLRRILWVLMAAVLLVLTLLALGLTNTLARRIGKTRG